MKPVIKWLIKWFLPGWHLAKNPAKGRKNKIRAVYVDPPHGMQENADG